MQSQEGMPAGDFLQGAAGEAGPTATAQEARSRPGLPAELRLPAEAASPSRCSQTLTWVLQLPGGPHTRSLLQTQACGSECYFSLDSVAPAARCEAL